MNVRPSALVSSQLVRLLDIDDGTLTVDQEAGITLCLALGPQTVLAALSYLENGNCEIRRFRSETLVVITCNARYLVDLERRFCCCREKLEQDLAQRESWCSHLVCGELAKIHRDKLVAQNLVAERDVADLGEWAQLHVESVVSLAKGAP
ncbi:uncharacterized protein OGAPODRAFT_14142 [Ogataea polymorpha]|uniref:uncharacterized protein n=1 Tax=Ogataea polymorpha TaxID=460523 RepID=UPI0007F42971|nr:uncharacterized protein OGAPODRAFT_14142 [Ogataea polymorpha]OBA14110.1 hypothetical protein OGAPODRAFT_14142 [Ogataea polymorpha]